MLFSADWSAGAKEKSEGSLVKTLDEETAKRKLSRRAALRHFLSPNRRLLLKSPFW
jgi:hypothetical protein